MKIREDKLFSGMNKDAELRKMTASTTSFGKSSGLFPYRDALNVHVHSSDTDNVGDVENLLGNTINVNFKDWNVPAGPSSWIDGAIPAGNNKCIGALGVREVNKVFYFLYNDTNDHSIYMLDGEDNNLYRIYKGSILNFSEDSLITGVGFIGDDLVWTDGGNGVRKIDTTNSQTIAHFTASQSEYYLSLIKQPPTSVLTPTRTFEVGFENNMDDRCFWFTYRYIYSDNTTSVWAPFSEQILSYAYNNGAEDRYNKITLDITTDNDLNLVVPYVEFAFKSKWEGPWKLIKRVLYGSNPSIVFRNEDTYEVLSNSDMTLISHSIPRTSQALKIAENRIFLANNKEDFDKPEFTVSRNSDIDINGLGVEKYLKSDSRYKYGILHKDEYGRNIGAFTTDEMYLTTKKEVLNSSRISFNLLSTPPDWATHYQVVRTDNLKKNFFIQGRFDDVKYITEYVDGVPTYQNLNFFPNVSDDVLDLDIDISYLTNNEFGYTYSEGDRMIIYTDISGDDLPLPSITLRVDGVPPVGEVFSFKINGIQYTFTCTGGGAIAEINWNLGAKSNFKFITAIGGDVGSIETSIRIAQTVTASMSGIATGTNPNPGYVNITAKHGDIFSDVVVGANISVFAVNNPVDEEIFVDLRIKKTTDGGDRIITEWLRDGNIYNLNIGVRRFEIYSPAEGVSDEFFYEIGPTYAINDAKTASRAYSSTTIIPTDGDTYNTLVVENQSEDLVIETPYVSLRYKQEEHKDLGKVTAELQDVRELNRTTSIRWGGTFLDGSSLNFLSDFRAIDDKLLPESLSPITHLELADDVQAQGGVMIAVHEINLTSLYLNKTIIRNQSGEQNITSSNEVIGAFNVLHGGYGSKNPESVVPIDGQIYGFDQTKGVLWRYTAQGVRPISELGMKNYFSDKGKELEGFGTNSRAYGSFDYYHKEYIVSLGQKNATNETIAFHADQNTFTSFHSYSPEFMAFLRTELYSFNAGDIYLHNDNSQRCTFYSTAYPASITLVSNAEPNKVKTLEHLSQDANTPWYNVTATSPQGQSTTLNENDFKFFEGVHYASILRDENTLNMTAQQVARLHGNKMRDQVFLIKYEYPLTGEALLHSTTIILAHSERSGK